MLSQTELREAWESKLQTITAVIAGRYRKSERDYEEKRQNALGHSWKLWPRAVEHVAKTHGGLVTDEVLHNAAKMCARRAAQQRSILGNPRRTLADALDHTEPVNRIEVVAERGESPATLNWSIAQISEPKRLHTAAAMLGAGCSKTDVAEELGVSRSTVSRLCDDIAVWIKCREKQAQCRTLQVA